MNRRAFLTAAAATPIALALPEPLPAASRGGTPLALVTADLESHVVALDLSSRRVAARVRTMPGPRSIESAFMTWAVVAHTTSGSLSILHAPTLAVHRVVHGFREPRYTAVHPSLVHPPRGPLAYVTDSARREIVTVDIVSGAVVHRTAVPGPARHISVSPDGGTLWTALGSKAQQVIVLDLENPRRPRVVRAITPPFRAHDVVFSGDGSHVWVTSGDSRRLSVYERDGRRPVAVLDAGAPPQHVAFRARRAFVASGDDGTMRTHREDGTLVHEARVPIGSYNVTHDWERVITPSLSRGTVALLDARGRMLGVRRLARAAHDACLVVGA
jgi:DNA-binding beta-propeller fold protein YncE